MSSYSSSPYVERLRLHVNLVYEIGKVAYIPPGKRVRGKLDTRPSPIDRHTFAALNTCVCVCVCVCVCATTWAKLSFSSTGSLIHVSLYSYQSVYRHTHKFLYERIGVCVCIILRNELKLYIKKHSSIKVLPSPLIAAEKKCCSIIHEFLCLCQLFVNYLN